MKVLTINTLEQALQYWEDANLFSELMFQSRIKNLNPSAAIYIPLPGSEVSEIGWLTRKIVNYESLRKEIESGSVKNPAEYLPRIPSKYKEKFDNSYTFLESQDFAFAQLPVHLASWMHTKKVCRVTQETEIPQIPLSENYLNLLPYDNFLLHLNDPFVFNTKEVSNGSFDLVQCYHTIFISKIENQIRLYVIGENLSSFCMEPVERKHVIEATRYAKNGKDRQYKQVINKIFAQRRVPFNFQKFKEVVGSFDPLNEVADLNSFNSNRVYNFTSRGETTHFFSIVITIPEQQNTLKEGLLSKLKASFSNSTKKQSVEQKDGTEKRIFLEILPEFLNGFCKVLSEAKSADLPESITVKDEENTPSILEKEHKATHQVEPLRWCDVPSGNIVDLCIEKDGSSTIKNHISTSSQKSPHVRRGHFRRYPQPDGTIKSVWISQSIIRKDRLEEEQIMSRTLTV